VAGQSLCVCAPPHSAGGVVNVFAPAINQSGTLRASMGTITTAIVVANDATNPLTLPDILWLWPLKP
jgi:hypothetical protein